MMNVLAQPTTYYLYEFHSSTFVRMDPPILNPLDLDPDPGYLFGGKYGDTYIIDQISQKPWYFFTVN